MKKLGVIIILSLIHFTIYAQQNELIEGILLDEQGDAIEFATVILQVPTDSHTTTTLSDSVGHYHFKSSIMQDYRLIFQHMLYASDTINIKANQLPPKTYILKEKSQNLGEVQIIGNRPFMKIEGNIISYDAKIITEKMPVSNALDVVKEIPGIIYSNEKLSLAGSDKLNIVINGQNSTMTLEQVTNILRGTPSSMVNNIEVMHNPPAKYNVKGALINIVLDKRKTSDRPTFSGELMSEYRQNYYASNPNRGSFSYTQDKVRIDLFTNLQYGKYWGESTSSAKHSLKQHIVEINEHTKRKGNYLSADTRLGLDYTINDNSNLIFSYYVNYDRTDGRKNSSNIYRNPLINQITSNNRSKDKEQLHNIYLSYNLKKIQIGGEYSYFKNPTTEFYLTSSGEDDINRSKQHVSKWNVFANNSSKLTEGLNINYGANFFYNNSKSDIHYWKNINTQHIKIDSLALTSEQKEYTVNLFADGSYKFNNKLTTYLSLKLEYFKADYIDNGIKGTLWKDWTIFPNASISYTINQKNTLQLNITSNKRYPSYWAINPQTTNLSSYSQIVGNPQLKPNNLYRTQLMYIHNKRYNIGLFVNYSPDYFTQIPHMSENDIKMIYRYENFDYQLRTGIIATCILKFGKVYNSRITLNGMYSREKLDNFHGSSFDNKSFSAVAVINNSFTIHPKLAFQVNFFYQSKAKQGVYRLGQIWSLDSSLKWTINKDLHVITKYNNILKRDMPYPWILDYGNQYNAIKNKEKSTFSISLTWKFGNYKKRDYNDIDTSRLGK